MRVLLDTPIWLWWLADVALAELADEAIRHPQTTVHVSAASVWEMAIKRSLGRLDTGAARVDDLEADGFEPLPIDTVHAVRAGELPPLHRDPFDRMLVAQAQLEELTIVTRDPRIQAYDVPVLAA